MLVIVMVGVIAILGTVFLGLGWLLKIVLREGDSAEDKKITMHALRDLVTDTFVAVAQVPGKLARALVESITGSIPGKGELSPPKKVTPDEPTTDKSTN